MKLTAFFLIVGLLQVSARSAAQVTIKETSAPLSKVLKAIQRQSKYDIAFDLKLIEAKGRPVAADLTNVPVEKALEEVFKNQDQLTYTLKDKFITVKEKVIKTAQLTNSVLDPLPPPTVHGRITNEKGEAVAGVSISIKGGKAIGVTNDNGEFTLTNVADNAVLVFSAINTETLEIKLNGRSELAFSLKTKTSVLDEVQMIAYGSTSKRLQTGNVTTVKGEDIAKQPVSNPLLALEGRVPGLFITQANGNANSGVTVRIQGINSIGNGNDPLYVIDGVPYSPQMMSTVNIGANILGNSGGQSGGIATNVSGNPLSYINPLDIESIDILKDADATAIYGSRGANGVILITTRKGKAGQTKGDINIQHGWGSVSRSLSVLNTNQYLQMRREALRNDNILYPSIATSPTNTDYDINGLWDTTRNTDWQKTLIGGTSQYTNVNGSISGGTAGVQYLVSGTYNSQTTVFPGNFSDEKGALHFSINSLSSNQKLRFQFSGNYMVDNNLLPNSDLTSAALTLPPDAPNLFKSDGTINWMLNPAGNSSWTNPIASSYNKYQNKTTNLLSNAIIGYKLFTGLEIIGSFGYSSLHTDEFRGTPLTVVPPESAATFVRNANYTNSTLNSWIVEPQITYKRKIGNGKIDLLLGSTFQQNTGNGFALTGTGFNSDAVLADIKSATSITVGSSTNFNYKYNAVFGRINYSWLDKYIVDFNIRRDGSSRFGSENQIHDFGSIGAGWIFSQENFMQKAKHVLSFGKIRASFGTTGNDQIPDYRFMNLYNVVSVPVAYQGASGLAPNGLTNPYLQWEETKKMQFGIDLGFIDDKILITGNYALNHSSNQLINYNLPIMTGFSGIYQNFLATVQNSSWELSINTNNISSKNLKWSSGFNISVVRNKLVEFPTLASSSYSQSLVIGQPINIKKVFHYMGVDPATGVYIVADSYGNPTTSPNSLTDNTVLINTLPDFFGGFQNTFNYHGFQLDFLFQFVKQTGMFSFFGNAPGSVRVNQPLTVLDRWQKPGDISVIQRYNSNSSLFLPSRNVQSSSDAIYCDASFIRLKNLSISYQFSGKWLQKARIENCRVYMQAQNLFTITSYKGIDPENQSTGSLPPLRLITAGVQVGL